MPSNKLFLFILLLSSITITSIVYAAAPTTSNCGGAYTYSNGPRKETSGYGTREAPSTDNGGQGSTVHEAVDIGMGASNTTGDYNAYSTVSGTVVSAGYVNGYGNTVIIESNGVRYLYAHASTLNVTAGQTVSAGQAISNYSGASTGNTTGAHIHYMTMVNVNGEWQNVDPNIVEGMILSGDCPTSSSFAQDAVTKTLAAHTDLTAADIVSKNGGGNSLTTTATNICAKTTTPTTPTTTPPAK